MLNKKIDKNNIMLRGYEAKYYDDRDEEGVVSGGVMWLSDANLHFTSGGILTVDLENAPFDFKDLMLSTNMETKNEIIFEKDIVQYDIQKTIGIVTRLSTGQWIVQSIKTHEIWDLEESIKEGITIIGNVPEQEDTFI